ncbi:hypothetical protein BDV93DRAFT_610034, partial [Ceratobasidium sp. AG-I]
MESLDTLSLLHLINSVSETPGFQKHLRETEISKIKQRKAEWGRPIEVLIPNTNPPTLIDFDGEPPSDDNVQAAIHLIQSTNPALPIPTCESFRIILRLMLDPGRLNLVNETTLLPSCIRLLRDHIKDTEEPMFCYEYGYLCFQVIVLTVQMAMICRGSGFISFKKEAATYVSKLIPEFITTHTWLQIESSGLEDSMAWILQASATPSGRRLLLPAVGGFTDLDAAFLVKEMWQSRKQFSYIGAKVPTHGWSFVIQVIVEHYIKDSKQKKRRDSILWGSLETLAHRYGLVSAPIETDYITDIPQVGTLFCTLESERQYVQRIIDEQDARTVVESYIARMTLKPDVEPLPTMFCATLADFVFQEEISTLGEILVPLLKVANERVWIDLVDGVVVRDVEWCVGFVQCVVHTLGCTERLFGAEHKFKRAEIESFLQVLHDIDIIGLIGQTLLMPMNLPPSVEVDHCWAKIVKIMISYSQTLAYSKSSSFAAKLFEAQYTDWLTTMSYIRRQVLYEKSRERSLRTNTKGCELAWKNVGKMFGFVEQAQHEGRGTCANPRCVGVFDGEVVCGRCCDVEYCSRLCQNMHWKLHTLDS